MSGVMGASLRSSVGSPACTATVSECGIGSAYRKPLVSAELQPVAQATQHRQPGLELGVVAGQQRALAPNSGGVGKGAKLLPHRQRRAQHLQVTAGDTQATTRLRFE